MTITWTATRTNKIHRTPNATRGLVDAMAAVMDVGEVLILSTDDHDDTPRCSVRSCEVDEDDNCAVCGRFFCNRCDTMPDRQNTTCEECAPC